MLPGVHYSRLLSPSEVPVAMTLQDVKNLVSNGENERLEFKRKVAHPDKIIREVVAFANTHGGYLLIGVDDNGAIPGVKFAEEEIFALNNAISKWCSPAIPYTCEIVSLTSKRAVAIYHIEEGARKPYFVKSEVLQPTAVAGHSQHGKKPGWKAGWTPGRKKKLKGKAYVRVEDKSLQASREVWQILRRKNRPKDIQFTYGEMEKLLMEFLGKHEYITLNQFKQLTNLPHLRASHKLVLLVLANVLEIVPREKEDIYRLRTADSW